MLVLCLSLAVPVLDQATKYAVRANSQLQLGQAIPVVPGFFSLQYVQNTGAAWGMFEGLNQWLVAFSLLVLVLILGFQRHFVPAGWLARIATGLIVGGIAGNLIDRVRLNYVVDFLYFYWHTYAHSFPAFNAADSAICTGVGLYLIAQLRREAGGSEADATSPRGGQGAQSGAL